MMCRRIVTALGGMGPLAKPAVATIIGSGSNPGKWNDVEQTEVARICLEALGKIDPDGLAKYSAPQKLDR